MQQQTLTIRKDIQKLEEVMLTMPQVDPEIKHYFLPGVYIREMHLKAGTTIVGKLHKKDHAMVISKGAVAIVSEQFEGVLEAPTTMTCKAGAKRAAMALEDTVWLAIHPTDKTNLVDIEEDLIASNYKDLEIG